MTDQPFTIRKDQTKIVLLEGIHPSATHTFNQAGYYNIVNVKRSLHPKALMPILTDAHLLGIRSRTQIDQALLDFSPQLTAIGCFCIGTNQVHLTETQARGIPVFNAPFANTRSVAELVLGEMILLLRGVPSKNAAAHRGEWLKSAKNAFEARGKVLGIIGYGHIGTQLGVLAENMGLKVQYYDIENKLALGNAQPVKDFHQLLSTSDIISFHVPETDITRNMMDKTAFSHLKAGAILINASRGSVVDINELDNALKTKSINGAAIDVFPQEPKSNQEAFISPLRQYDNVIITPHIGGSTLEAQANIGIEVSEKLIKYNKNGSTLSAINFPVVSLPSHSGKHRICHIHKNEPGILAQITEALSSNNVNISGQYLQTKGNIGYVVTDIDQASSHRALEAIQKIPRTIRTRILY